MLKQELSMSRKEYISSLILFLMAVISGLAIKQGDTTLVSPVVPTILTLVNYALSLSILPLLPMRRMTKQQIIFLFFIGMYFFFNSLHSGPFGSAKLSFLNYFILFELAFITGKVFDAAFQFYRKFLLYMSVCSIITYIAFLLKLSLPHEVVPYYASGQNTFYVNYYVSYLYMMPSLDGLRACGLFNEPGYFGTIIALSIIGDKFRKNWTNLILFCAGLLTLSAAYIILLVIGLILLNFNKLKSWLVGVVFVLFLAAIVIPNIKIENPVILSFIERFEYNKDTGKFVADNRLDPSFEFVEKRFKNSDYQAFGLGCNSCTNLGLEASASYKINLIEWGYIGFAIVYGLFFLSVFLKVKGNKSAIILMFCLMISVYQRPNVFFPTYIVILFGGIEFYRRLSIKDK